MRGTFSERGFTDKLYVVNFVAVQAIVLTVVALTALSGVIEITDMSALASIPPCAYAELGIHTGFVVWKAKTENCRKNKDCNRLSSLESEEEL